MFVLNFRTECIMFLGNSVVEKFKNYHELIYNKTIQISESKL